MKGLFVSVQIGKSPGDVALVVVLLVGGLVGFWTVRFVADAINVSSMTD